MNKKTITKTLALMILLILLSFSIRANIFATIGMKGLSFANPQAASAVQTVMQAYQITTDPSGFITGQITGQITGEIMGEIAKQSPEAAKAIQQYQEVDSWIKEGAKITEDLKLDETGKTVAGKMEFTNKQNIESITDKKIGEVENMKFSATGEDKPYQLTASQDGASATIGENTYKNLGKDSTITINRETGKIDGMDATFTEATTIKVNEDEIKVPKGARVVYKDGKYDIYGNDQEVEVNKQKIQINGENSINYDGKKITGKDFTIDEKRFTGIETESGMIKEPAQVTITDKGYILGKNTVMTDNRMIITSEKGEVLYSKMCGDVSGFNNYVNPCTKTLTAEGDGFSVRIKEGKQFGLDIKKDDVYLYKLEGGKVILDNGNNKYDAPEGKYVIVIDNEGYRRYGKEDGVMEEFILANDLTYDFQEWSISQSNEYGDMGNIINEQGVETVYAQCSGSPTGRAVTNQISGMITFKDYCAVVGLNTKSKLVGTYWGDKKDGVKITGVSNIIKYPDGTSSMLIQTKEPTGEQWYSLSSNGGLYQYNQATGKWVLTGDQVTPESVIGDFKMQATVNAPPAPSNTPPTTIGKEAAAENLGEKVFTGGGAPVYFKGTGTTNRMVIDGEFYQQTSPGCYESPIVDLKFKMVDKNKFMKVNNCQ